MYNIKSEESSCLGCFGLIGTGCVCETSKGVVAVTVCDNVPNMENLYNTWL